MRTFVGCDVAKASLQAAIWQEGRVVACRGFGNDAKGHGALLRWAVRHGEQPVFCLEATGVYGEALARFLSSEGVFVAVENPASVRSFLCGLKVMNKTDRLDAKGIAQYASLAVLRAYRPPSASRLALRRLLARRRQLERAMRQEENRQKEPGNTPFVAKSISRNLRFLQKELREVEKEMQRLVAEDAELSEAVELLTSIKGIAQKTALTLCALLPELGSVPSAKSLAAYAGLNPVQTTSGTSVRRASRVPSSCHRGLRAALYMPAQCAIRFNAVVRRLYQRLLERGKTKMQALVAAMRKLMTIVYSVLKNRRPFFDPCHT